MNTDSYFTIGNSHKVCQDYCYHEQDLAIVSDGCSSSKDTDIGARLLVHTYKNTKEARALSDKFPITAIYKASTMSTLLGLEESCLDATLISLEFKNDVIASVLFGDGVRIIVNADDSVLYETFEFTDNKPQYLSYNLNPERLAQYYKEIGELQVKRTTVNLTTKETIVEEYKTRSEDKLGNSFSASNMKSNEPLKAAFIATDGLESFVRDGEALPLIEVVRELTNIKSWRGPFVERKVKRMITKFKKLGYDHYDDIGVAGIYLGE